MKRILNLIALISFLFCKQTNGQYVEPPHTWHTTLTIVDQNGKRVPQAEVSALYAIKPSEGSHELASETIRGLTDTNGVFSASHSDRSLMLLFRVKKTGYYNTQFSYEVSKIFEPIEYARLTINQTLILKKIDQPIPMYAKRVNLGMPIFDKPIGYDLIIGDWVSPYGKGRNSDFIFNAHLDKRSRGDSDYKLILNFPNKGDGIQEFKLNDFVRESDLHSPHEAPIDGYQTDWVQTKVRRPKKPLEGNWDASRNYFFRVRTLWDANENIKSALYGKIYGDFLEFSYFINPQPNSRNVEFDTKKNLFIKLPFLEEVKEP